MLQAVRRLAPLLAGLAASYLAGIGWGLPSAGRAGRVFLPGQRTEAFYRRLEDNRIALHREIGWNLQAAFGRGSWSGTLLPPTARFELVRYRAGAEADKTLMHGFSSFMMRSVEQDEQFVLNSISRFKPRRLDFNPHESLYGGAYLYPAAAFLAAAHLAGALRLTPDAVYYYRNPGELARLYKAGRMLSALASLGCAVVVYLLGRLLYGERVGLWSAVFFGFSPAVNAFAHVMKPHLPAAFLALCCLLESARGVRSERMGPFLRAALFFGLAVGAVKYFWVLTFPLCGAFLVARGRAGLARALAALAGLNLLAMGVFFAVNPYVPAEWRDFLSEMRGMERWYPPSLNPLALARLIWVPLRLGLGTACWAAALGGLAAALLRRGRSDRLALLLLLPMLAVTSFQTASASADPGTIRFFLPGMALLAILGTAWILEGLGPRRAAAAGLALGLLLACDLVGAAFYDANFLADSRGRSNSFQAGAWIEENLPAGSCLGLGTPAPMLDRFPPLHFSRYELVYFQGPLGEAPASILPQYYLTNARWIEGLPDDFKRRYRLERLFDRGVLGGRAFQDMFTSANFPVALFIKKSS